MFGAGANTSEQPSGMAMRLRGGDLHCSGTVGVNA